MEISIFTISLSYLVLLVLSFILGFSSLRLIKPDLICKCNLITSSPIVISVGLSISVALWWLSGLLFFNAVTFLSLPVISAIVLELFRMRFRSNKSDFTCEKEAGCRILDKSAASIIFVSLFVASAAYFIITTSYLSWPQIGDPWFHGRYITMIMEQSKIATDFLPYDTSPITYPMGFHVVVAGLALSLNITPGVAMISTASLVMVLLTLLPAWFVYRRTNSVIYTTLSALAVAYIHPIGYAQNSVYLNFLNGTYPVLLGFVMLFAFIAIFLECKDTDTRSDKFIFIAFSIVVGVAIFAAYPFLLLIPGMLLFLLIITNVKFPKTNLLFPQSSRNLRILGLILLAGFIGVIISFGFLLSGFQSAYVLLSSTFSHSYQINAQYFQSIFYLIILFLAIGGAIITLVSTESNLEDIVSVVFLILLLFDLMSLLSPFYDAGLGIILPARTMMFLQIWALVYCMLMIQKIETRVPAEFSKKFQKLRFNPKQYYKVVVGFVLVLSMSSSIIGLATYDVQSQAAWYTRSEAFTDDLAGAYYVRDNMDYRQLILNYETQSDWALPSVGLPNVVFHLPLNASNFERAHMLEEIWFHPENETLVRMLLEAYNVKIVYVSSPLTVRRFIDGNGTFVNRSITASECYGFFIGYSFLEPVFLQGNCSVFQVMP